MYIVNVSGNGLTGNTCFRDRICRQCPNSFFSHSMPWYRYENTCAVYFENILCFTFFSSQTYVDGYNLQIECLKPKIRNFVWSRRTKTSMKCGTVTVMYCEKTPYTQVK